MRTSLKQAARLFWLQRSRRERGLLTVMAVLLAVAGFCNLVWVPLSATERRLDESVRMRQAQVVWLQSLTREAASLREQPLRPPLAASELMALLRQGAIDAGLALDRTTLLPEGEHGVVLQGKVVFDDWLRCAAILSERYHLRLTAFHVESDAAPGQVSVRAVFVHGGAEA
ncbi:type II secretion system protein GspM [Paludibacterium yongneupense]|uniref:type II secretion system protein GspM n=1 Tax=Paludibacterium yongneupense TaxID=400061 RepID=UPI0004088EBF|nr:type II secretion system protein GspM [Paludibacterium yongneupense]